MQVRELSDASSRREWNDFIAGSGDLLQSWEWGDLKARSGWHPTRILILDHDRPVAGVCILTRYLKDLLRENMPPLARLPLPARSICYAPHGPVVPFENPEAVKAVLDAAAACARRKGGFLLKVEPVTEEEIVDAELVRNGFHRSSVTEGFGGTQPRCVMQLPLDKDLDTILAECKQKTRYNIRLAERKGVSVRMGCSPEDLRAFYDLLRVTAERDRFLVRGFQYYQDMWEILRPAGEMKLFLAEHEGTLLSGAILFLFGRWCVYAYGASSNENRQLMPNYLMQWEMIRWASQNGYQVYDFRGVSPNRDPAADDHLAGLNRFKEGFGARFVEYPGDYDRVLRPTWNLLWSRTMPRLRTALKRREKAEGA